jgi:predicted 2-oxoglutarate/Fe(II)-dependent dioxygenase YbiX/peroxiredoxin
MARFFNLQAGDPAPWFRARTALNPRYSFDTVGGRYVVLCFVGSVCDAVGQSMLADIKLSREYFTDEKACLFGLSHDPEDESQNRFLSLTPGIRWFWDFDASVSRQYGAVDHDLPENAKPGHWRRFWLVLDPTLRIMKRVDVTKDSNGSAEVMDFIRSLPPPYRFAGFDVQAPVLVLPRVFEPELCHELIAAYEAHGGEESGFMRQIDGKTHLIKDKQHKVRRDFMIDDEAMQARTLRNIVRRVSPEIQKIHNFTVSRMERYIVACYAAEEGGHFNAHRDNTTSGTAHRRFAVSINLNDDFDGGEVFFPEYGMRSFKPPAGGAVVFSCSLLHAVTHVTRGKRYAFLPFLYDEAAASIRAANNDLLADAELKYTATA